MLKMILGMKLFRKFAVSLVRKLLDKHVWPLAYEYVLKSENPYDNIALDNARNLVNDLLDYAEGDGEVGDA